MRGAEVGVDFAERFFGVLGGAAALVGEGQEPEAWGSNRTAPLAPADAPDALRRILDAVTVADASAGSVSEAYKALATRELRVPEGGTAIAQRAAGYTGRRRSDHRHGPHRGPHHGGQAMPLRGVEGQTILRWQPPGGGV